VTDDHILEFAPPYYCDLPKIDELVLNRPYVFVDGDMCCVVPATGWLFDGASIPRVFWRLIGHPLRGEYRRGALAHDGGYKGILLAYRIVRATDMVLIAADLEGYPNEIPATLQKRKSLALERVDVDNLLYDLARWNGTSKLKAATMRRAVRMFGGCIWRQQHAKWAAMQQETPAPNVPKETP